MDNETEVKTEDQTDSAETQEVVEPIDYTKQIDKLIENTDKLEQLERLEKIEKSNTDNQEQITEIKTTLSEIKQFFVDQQENSPDSTKVTLSDSQVTQLQEVTLAEDQVQRLNKKYEKELNETVATYFSVALGIVLTYIALKGLFAHWKSS